MTHPALANPTTTLNHALVKFLNSEPWIPSFAVTPLISPAKAHSLSSSIPNALNMTDIHAWRLNAQFARNRPTDSLINDLLPPDGLSLSTIPGESRPRPRRSLASFATYLNTHRTASSGREPEWPMIDVRHFSKEFSSVWGL